MRALTWAGGLLLTGALATLAAFVAAGDPAALRLRRRSERLARILGPREPDDRAPDPRARLPFPLPLTTVRCECGAKLPAPDMLGHLIAGHAGRPPYQEENL